MEKEEDIANTEEETKGERDATSSSSSSRAVLYRIPFSSVRLPFYYSLSLSSSNVFFRSICNTVSDPMQSAFFVLLPNSS